MKLCLLFSAFSFLFATFTRAATVEGNINFPDGATSDDLLQTNIELIQVSNPHEKSLRKHTYIQRNGHFELHHVPQGVYVLSVSSIKYNLQPFKLRIDIDDSDEILVRAIQGAQPFDQALLRVPHPIQYIVNQKTPERTYVKSRVSGILESGPLATIINNPLYLTGLLFAIGIIAAPYLLEKFDPEVAKQVKERKLRGVARTQEPPEELLSLKHSINAVSEKDEKKADTAKEIKAENIEPSEAKESEKKETKKRNNKSKSKKN